MATTPTIPAATEPTVPPEVPVVPAATTKVFTRDEVEAAVTKARREEKDKLYNDLERSRKSEERLNGRVTELQTQLDTAVKADTPEAQKLLNQVTDLRTQLEAETKRRESFERGVEKQIDEALTKQSESFEQTLRQKDQQSLGELRTTLIEAAGGQIIPELVTGSTAAELRASVEKSKARYLEIAGPPKTPVTPPETVDTLPAPVTAPGAVATTDTPARDTAGWRRLSPDERTKQLADMKSKAFATAGLPMKK